MAGLRIYNFTIISSKTESTFVSTVLPEINLQQFYKMRNVSNAIYTNIVFADLEAMEEYCSLESYRPQCWKNEVIVVAEALYGRRRTGKCISAEQASKLHGPEYFGCYANVLHIVSRKCSGRKACEVNVPDSDLEQTMPCLEGLKMFLEVRYSCVAGMVSISSCWLLTL